MTGVARARGYTAVELLMAIAVLAIGVSGIIAMQKITVVSNRHSRNLAIATQIARAWQDVLVADAALWNSPSPLDSVGDRATDTMWLGIVGAGWDRPAQDPNIHFFGPAFDALGNVVFDEDIAQAHFCTHLRLTWLMPEGLGQTGLIRTEVRVFWVREGMGGPINEGPVCADGTNPQRVGEAVNRYHFVYMTSAVKQNPPTR